MKKKAPAFLILGVITLIAAVLLAVTNAFTAGPIEVAAQAAADAARAAVLPGADAYEPVALKNGAQVDNLYIGSKGGAVMGYTATATVQGSQGPVEVTLGADAAGVITGVSVGGSKFAETAGLGTECQKPAFTDQFIGKSGSLALGSGVDAISGATITSTAVVKGANLCTQAIAEASK